MILQIFDLPIIPPWLRILLILAVILAVLALLRMIFHFAARLLSIGCALVSLAVGIFLILYFIGIIEPFW